MSSSPLTTLLNYSLHLCNPKYILIFFKHSFRLALFPFCLQLCLSNCLFHCNCIREECSSSLSICIFLMWKHWDERCPSASTWKCGKGSLEKVFSSSPRAGEQRHQLQHLCSDKRHSGSGSSARGTGRRKGEEERQKRFGKTQWDVSALLHLLETQRNKTPGFKSI